MKYVVSGLEDSGKSLWLARVIRRVANRNARWLRVTGTPRPIITNMWLHADFVRKCENEGVPVRHFLNLHEIVDVPDADIFIDEIGTYFDSRMWADIPLDVRRWLAQASKRGTDIYGTAQDFAQVDKSFRRLVNQLQHVVKFIGSDRPTPSRPPVKKPWGVCLRWDLNPTAYAEDNKQIEGFLGLPIPFFITKEDCDTYDTRQLQKKSEGMPLQHSERRCIVCGKVHITHA